MTLNSTIDHKKSICNRGDTTGIDAIFFFLINCITDYEYGFFSLLSFLKIFCLKYYYKILAESTWNLSAKSTFQNQWKRPSFFFFNLKKTQNRWSECVGLRYNYIEITDVLRLKVILFSCAEKSSPLSYRKK